MWDRIWFVLGRASRRVTSSAWKGVKRTAKSARGRKRPSLGTALKCSGGLLERRIPRIASGLAGDTISHVLESRWAQASSSRIPAVEREVTTLDLWLREHASTISRIGVDGLPGSGKSTLARALASRLGLGYRSLDYGDLDQPDLLATERTVYEHHRLLRTQDVDAFDVIVYIDATVEVSRHNIEARGQGRLLDSVVDFEKLKTVGEIVFAACDGEPIRIRGSDLIAKIRPVQGFRALENLATALVSRGEDPEGMNLEELAFLMAYGKRQCGLSAYLLRPDDAAIRLASLALELDRTGR